MLIKDKNSTIIQVIYVLNENLVLNNLGLAYSRAIIFFNGCIDLEELKSIARFGLVKAASTFECDRNIKFTTYASKVIDNEIRMFIRKKNNYTKNLAYPDFDEDLVLNSIKPSNDCTMEERIADKDIFMRAINEVKSFSERDREMFYFHIFKGYTTIHIGKLLGVSQSYVSARLKIIYNKIRHNLRIDSPKTLTKK